MLDPITQKNIADALWLEKFDKDKLPLNISRSVFSNKNSNEALSKRMRDYLAWLKNHQQDHNPNYGRRYDTLIDATREINPQQAYIISSFLTGNNSTQGYEPMPSNANLKFPIAHHPKWRSKVDWHFFVGSAWDEKGQEYGIEVMFFRLALMPPDLAKKMGLSDIENQVIELQLGISKAGDRHHQADPVIVSGTTGLINFKPNPFNYTFGKNGIRSQTKEDFFPLNVKAHGIDRESKEGFGLGINLTFIKGKETLLQGEDGCSPCIAGMGTLYYSVPNLVLKPGSKIKYGDKTITLSKGIFWFDHQWGFLGGNANAKVLRAASDISKPGPAGWDWYMAQFSKDRQITMYAMHTKKNLPYYFQTGPTPPPTMVVPVAGKYFDENKKLATCVGTLTIDKWIKSEQSPNPNLYLISHAWHPNNWKFKFDEDVPEDIREFSMEQIVPTAQTNFFANSAQYNEGAVYLKDKDGKDIGRGFAEAVQYASPLKTTYHIMGYESDDNLQKILKHNYSSPFKRFLSFAYMITHQKQLKDILAKSKGVNMLDPKSAKGGHTPRHK